MQTRSKTICLAACLAAGIPLPFVSAAETKSPAWESLWQDAYIDIKNTQIDPEKISVFPAVDRATGDAFLCGWGLGVWKSGDGGKTFARVDGGKITGPTGGPVWGNDIHVSPEGRKIAIFGMIFPPSTRPPSGYSLDGGATWTSFANLIDCAFAKDLPPMNWRDFEWGAMDWDSQTALAEVHETYGCLVLTTDAGKTWTEIARWQSSGLGVVDRNTLLRANPGNIERSEDGGKTWKHVSDFGAAGPMLRFKNRFWWISGSRKSVIVSGDEGKTWAVQGEALPAVPVLGPFFGMDENHVVVATPAGFYETTDGCKNWKVAVALPESYSLQLGLGPIGGAAFDPVHDVFYVTNQNKPAMKYCRSATVTVPPVAVYDAPGRAKQPLADYVEEPSIRGSRPMLAVSAELCRGYLYVCGTDGLLCFKQDVQSGKLTFLKALLEARQDCGGFTIKAAGGRLYGVTPHDGYKRMKWHGLAWYEIDPTGIPVQKGVVACPASRQIVVSSDQTNLYLKSCGKEEKLFWYRIGADGEPSLAGEVSGKGIGANSHNIHPSILQIAPDGRHLYCISSKDYAIACIERRSTGEIAYKSAFELEELAKRDPGNDAFQWVALGFSPDGKWLYASVRNGKPTDNFYGIFKRDPETGALSLKETVRGDRDVLANLKGWNMVFPPDSRGGYLGSWFGPLLTFRYDAQTGRLNEPSLLRETYWHGSFNLLLDAENGFLYGAGGDYGVNADSVTVFKTERRVQGTAREVMPLQAMQGRR